MGCQVPASNAPIQNFSIVSCIDGALALSHMSRYGLASYLTYCVSIKTADSFLAWSESVKVGDYFHTKDVVIFCNSRGE